MSPAAHVATAAGGIIFFFTYLPCLYLTFSYSQRTHFQKVAFCLLSNVAMGLGVRLISAFEIKGEPPFPREAALQLRQRGGRARLTCVSRRPSCSLLQPRGRLRYPGSCGGS